MRRPTFIAVLKRTLRLWVFLPGVACILGMGLLFAHNGYTEIKKRNHAVSGAISQYVFLYLDDTIHALNHFIKRIGPDNTEVNDLLAILFGTSPHFKRLLWLSEDGTILAASPSGTEGLTFPINLNFSNGRKFISRLVISPDSGAPVIYLGEKLRSGNILVGELDAIILSRHLGGLLPPGNTFILTDRFGNIISHPDRDKVLQQENIGDIPLLSDPKKPSSATRLFIYDGTLSIGSVATVPGADWKIIILSNASTVFAPVLNTVLFMFGMVMLLFLLINSLLNKRLTTGLVHPLETFIDDMRKLAAGGDISGHPERSTFREMETVEEEFRKMFREVRGREEELSENAERYRALFYDNRLVQLLTDPTTGKILDVNRRALDYYGYARSTFDTLTIFDINAQSEEFILQVVRRAQSLTTGTTTLTRHALAGGEERDVEVHISPMILHGTVHHFVTVIDVTDKKRDEERLAEINRTFLTFGTDPEDNIRTITELCGRIMGADHAFYNRKDDESVNTCAIWDIAGDTSIAGLDQGDLCARVISGDTDEALIFRHLADSSHADTNPSLISLGVQTYFGQPVRCLEKTVGALCAIFRHDKKPTETDRKLLGILASALCVEEQRQKAKEELEASRDQAQAASDAKSQFLANMSHELRTPLNGVFGMMQLLRDTPLSRQQREYVETAQQTGNGLLTILNDILDFSSMKAGTLRLFPKQFNVSQTLSLVLDNYRPDLERRGIRLAETIHDDVPERVTADAGRLRQILFNLIGNASKFTPEGEIRVEVFVVPTAPSPTQGIMLGFHVSDTGIGIPAGKREQVFRPFSQADSSYARQHQGTGLGLGIVKKLVQIMGGTVTLESEEGKGTTVTFTMQVELPEAGAPNPKPTEIPDIHGMRFLVVEDDRVNRLAITSLLGKVGAEAATASNGREALALQKEQQFDCILMDIEMPDMGGVEATRALRDEGDTVPIIALTGHAHEDARAAFLAEGMNGYVSKPVEFDELCAEIVHVLETTPHQE